MSPATHRDREGTAEVGFHIAPSILERLSGEAMGSPQLMQVLCLNLCRELETFGEKPADGDHTKISDDTLNRALEISANFANSSEMVQALHSGPKVKGQPRTQYNFTDGSRGDVYRAMLLAITSDPIARDFIYDDIYARVKAVCINEYPTGQSISNSLNQMCLIAKSMAPDQIIMEWDDASLHIADVYLAFYMRASSKIEQLNPVSK